MASNNPKASAPPVTIRGYLDASKKQWVEVTFKEKKALIQYSRFVERAGIWASLSGQGLNCPGIAGGHLA